MKTEIINHLEKTVDPYISKPMGQRRKFMVLNATHQKARWYKNRVLN